MKPFVAIFTHVHVYRVRATYKVVSTLVRYQSPSKAAVTSLAYPLWFVLLMLLVNTIPVSANTAIVAVWNPRETVIAADSKEGLVSLADGTRQDRIACKIYRFGSLFYAYSGTIATHSQSGFDARLLIEKALSKGKFVSGKAQGFEDTVTAPLLKALEMVRQDNLAYFERELLKGNPLQLLIAGIEDGKAVMSVRGFKIISGHSAPIQLQTTRIDCPQDCAPQGKYVLLGEHNAIDRFLSNPANNDIWNHGLISAASFLVSLEIFGTPQTVGPPVDILRITRTGAEWIQKKPECEEPKKAPAKTPVRNKKLRRK